MPPIFEVFDVIIGQPMNGTFPLKSFCSQTGEGNGILKLPFSYADLETNLQHMQRIIVNTPSQEELSDPEVHQMSVRQLGQALYEALFPDEIGHHLTQALNFCLQQQKRLCIKMRFNGRREEMTDMFRLPWELAVQPHEPVPLARKSQVHLVRYLEIARPIRDLPIPDTLKILVVLADPGEEATYNRDRVRQSLTEAWQGHRVELHFLNPPTLEELDSKLNDEDWHILHFTGHGGKDEEWCLAFEDERGESDLVGGSALASTLEKALGSLRLVNLISCEGARSDLQEEFNPFDGVAQALIYAGLPAVTAMQFPISIPGSEVYTKHLYQNLAASIPFLEAVDKARQKLFIKGRKTVEWAAPVVFMRQPERRLFEEPQRQRIYMETVHPMDRSRVQQLRNEKVQVLDFTRYFEGEQRKTHKIQRQRDWNDQLLYELEKLKPALDPYQLVEFEGNAWLSIWVAAGFVFCAPSGFHVQRLQSNDASGEKEVWSSRAEAQDMPLEVDMKDGDLPSEDLLVIGSLNRNIEHAVDRYVNDHGLTYKKKIHMKANRDPESFQVAGNGPALGLAEAMARKIRDSVNRYDIQRTHLFLACPASVALFLGRRLSTCRQIQVYEFENRSYAPSFTLN